MMGVLARRFDDMRSGNAVRLSKSYREGIADGDQRRDFIYVDDVVRVIMWLLASGRVSGIFNVGTGRARSFRDLIVSATRRWALVQESKTSTCRSRYATAINTSRGVDREIACCWVQRLLCLAGRCCFGLYRKLS